MDKDTRFTFSRLVDVLAFICAVIAATDLLLGSIAVWGLDSWIHGTTMCWPGVLASWLIACFVVVVALCVRKGRKDGR